MKVLFLTNIPSPYRVDFFEELGKQCDLTVLYEKKKANNREWQHFEKNNYRTVYLKGIKTSPDTAICFEVLKYLKKEFDIIVIGGYSTPTGMLAIEYLKRKKIPFYINCDGGFIKEERKWIYLIKKHYIKSASYWLSSGNETTKYLTHYGAVESKIFQYPFSSIKKVDILQNSISNDEKEILKKELGITENKVVISVGQFIYRKGFDILIKASKNLGQDVGIYIVGGIATNEYLKLAKTYNGAKIHFVGFCTKEVLNKYYSASDIMAFPTREDIWGLVVNEALAKRLPIVSSNKCIAALELIDDAGIIVPVEDVDALSSAIKKILNNVELRNNMSEEANNKAKEYTIENMANKHMEIFKNNL